MHTNAWGPPETRKNVEDPHAGASSFGNPAIQARPGPVGFASPDCSRFAFVARRSSRLKSEQLLCRGRRGRDGNVREWQAGKFRPIRSNAAGVADRSGEARGTPST